MPFPNVAPHVFRVFPCRIRYVYGGLIISVATPYKLYRAMFRPLVLGFFGLLLATAATAQAVCLQCDDGTCNELNMTAWTNSADPREIRLNAQRADVQANWREPTDVCNPVSNPVVLGLVWVDFPSTVNVLV